MARTKKPYLLNTRISEEDLKKFEEICEKKKRTKSDMIRILIQNLIDINDA